MVHVKRLLRFTFIMAALIAVMSASLYAMAPKVAEFVGAHRSDHERISLDPLAERSYIFDRRGNLQGTLINSENQNRVQVPLAEVPETVTGAILAVEDQDFYEHKGVNLRSIGRAVDANLESGETVQGGSTITQQVVKNSLIGDEQTLSRKIREAFLAVELEKQMDKDEILERYVNSVYFGGGAYGVQAASEYYFNKNVKDLNWAEGSLLAALIRSPNSYDPFENPDLARERRAIVFDRLIETERLTADEVEVYELVPLPTEPNVPLPPNDYFVEEVKQQLLDDPKYGLGATPAARNRTVFEGGIRVFTTFDPNTQFHAIQARDQTLPNNKGDATFDVTDPRTGSLTFGTIAMASVEPSSGAVRAIVGGPGFERYKYNLATQLPGRQPGSSMKTFVLAALYENGFVPSDTVSGRGSCTFSEQGGEDYRVRGGAGGGTIQRLIASSANCGFVRLGQVVGIDTVVDMAKRLGVRSPLEEVRSLPLGVNDISPLDMAGAYATFANDGMYNEPYFVDRIEDRDGKVIYQHEAAPQRVVDVQTARLVNQSLQTVVTGGTGRNAQIANGQPAAGKTGTTQEEADVWFVGYTPQLSTAVWMGAPAGRISLANAGLGGATGGKFPATTWGAFYSSLLAGQPIVDFAEPDTTRRGKSVGRIPNEIGSQSPSNPRPNTGGNGGNSNPGGSPGTVPTTPGGEPPTPTEPEPTTPQFGG